MRAWPRKIILVHTVLSVAIALFVGLSLAVIGRPWLALAGPAVGAVHYALSTRRFRRRRRLLREPFPEAWRRILEQRVRYYSRLPPAGRRRFEDDVRIFLLEQRIFGEKGATVDSETRVLIAAGAAMLGHSLPDWEWSSVRDIVVYPRAFDEEYRPDREAVFSGMVHHQGPIVLSQRQVLEDFQSESGQNVVLHELAHVIDFADGRADGAPPDFETVSPIRWLDVISNRLERVRANRGALREYAGKNEAELFAVAVETFFEQPEHLKRRDPTLYRMLSSWFDQDPADSAPEAFPGHAIGQQPLSAEEEPWAPSFALSDVSNDPVAAERVAALGSTESELRALGFERLGIARAVSTTDPAVQRVSRVLGSSDGLVLCSLTPTPRGPDLELATLFDDGSVVKTAPRPNLWRRLRVPAGLRQHPDDAYDFATVSGSTPRVLARHLERVAAFEALQHVAPVPADSMRSYFALRLRAGELRDARRPAEARIARRIALLGAALLGALIWAPFLARVPTPHVHRDAEAETETPPASVRPDTSTPPDRGARLAYLGLVIAGAVAAGAYGSLQRGARVLFAARLARLRPGPRKRSATELLGRAERIEHCSEASLGAPLTNPGDDDTIRA